MENYLNSTDDQLIKNLDYSLPSSSNYITDRKSVLFQPLGASSYSHNSNRIIKFRLTGDNWLDPSTVRIQYTLRNTNAASTALNLLSPVLPTNFFRRMRILGANTQIEDLEHYNRLCVMMNMLKPIDSRICDTLEGFGINDDLGTSNGGAYPKNQGVDFNSMNYNIQIKGGKKRTVLFKPLCGLFNQTNYLPLRYLPIEIELELCNSKDEPLLGTGDYVIEDLQLHADLVVLDSSIDSEFTDHILSGKPLSIHLNSFFHTYSIISKQENPVVSFNRAHTRIKRVYVSFYKRLKQLAAEAEPLPKRLVEADVANPRLKEFNLFWHPQLLSLNEDAATNQSTTLANTIIDSNDFNGDVEIESQCQLGSKNVPEQYMRHSTSQFYYLKKSLNAHHDGSYSFGMTPMEYRTHKHIQVFDFQKVNNVFGSGVSTRQGDLITVKLQNLVSKIDNVKQEHGYADSMYMVLEYDKIVDISDSGITVMD